MQDRLNYVSIDPGTKKTLFVIGEVELGKHLQVNAYDMLIDEENTIDNIVEKIISFNKDVVLMEIYKNSFPYWTNEYRKKNHKKELKKYKSFVNALKEKLFSLSLNILTDYPFNADAETYFEQGWKNRFTELYSPSLKDTKRTFYSLINQNKIIVKQELLDKMKSFIYFEDFIDATALAYTLLVKDYKFSKKII